MEPESIRQKLHAYIDKGDEKLLKLMYAVAREYNEDDDFEYEFSADDIEQLEQRRNSRLSGANRTYSWQEAKDILIGKKEMP